MTSPKSLVGCFFCALLLVACSDPAAIAAKAATLEKIKQEAAAKAAQTEIAAKKMQDEAAARALVIARLKDPDSARFGRFDLGREGISSNGKRTAFACLTVNAKNSMGGYTGDQQVVLFLEDIAWSVIKFLDPRYTNHQECIDIWLKEK